MPVADAVVDALNVAWERRTGDGEVVNRPSWKQLLAVVEAWRRDHPDNEVFVIADASIMERMRGNRVEIDRAREDGWLDIATGDADDRILAEAEKTQAVVISSDNFVAHRRRYPWTSTADDRFFAPRIRRGEITFAPRTLKAVSDEEIDRAEEAARLKATRMSADTAEKQWRCTSSEAECSYGGDIIDPELLKRSGGEVLCGCGAPAVEETDYRDLIEPTSIRLAVFADGHLSGTITVGAAPEPVVFTAAAPFRERLAGRPPAPSYDPATGAAVIPLDNGQIALGRGRHRSSGLDITTGLGATAAGQVSRVHLMVEADDLGEITVTHEGATSATLLNPTWDGDRPVNGRLLQGTEYAVEPGDVLFLGSEELRVEVSAT